MIAGWIRHGPVVICTIELGSHGGGKKLVSGSEGKDSLTLTERRKVV